MVTEICTNVALGGGEAGAGTLDKDTGRQGGDPLPFNDLNVDGVVFGWFIDHWGRSR